MTTPTPPLSTAVADLDLDKIEASAHCGLGASPVETLKLAALARSAAPAPAAATELPTNEVLEELWETTHYGHPADFGADVLQRWGGWQEGLLGYGGSLNGPLAATASDIAAAPEQQQDHVAPPTRGTDSQHEADLLGEILSLALQGVSYGMLADNLCGQIVEKITGVAPHVAEAQRAAETESYRANDAEKLAAARHWIKGARHGDNCFLHDEGEYNRCFCGKESLEAYIEAELSPPDGAMPERKLVPAKTAPQPLIDAINQWDEPGNAKPPLSSLANLLTVEVTQATINNGFSTVAAQPAEGSAQVASKAEQTAILGSENQCRDLLLQISRAAPERSDTPWHDAVLAECMRVESCYKADDPVASLAALIDWHAHSSDTASTNKVLADNYIKLTCSGERSDTPAGLDKLTCDEVYDETCRLHAEHRAASQKFVSRPAVSDVLAAVRNLLATPTAASQALDAAPAGFKLVPIEPTGKMIGRGRAALYDGRTGQEVSEMFVKRCYDHMIAAAPAAEGATQASDAREPWIPYLADRADGCAGRYAIARWNPDGYREVWNLHSHQWAAFSDDVLTLDQARDLLRKLVIPTARIDGDKQGAQGEKA